MVTLDGDLASIPGETTIEICDLFSASRQFIHVKRTTRSKDLSHLLAQGSVSAKLFHQYPDYRQQFRERLPASMRQLIATNNVRPEEYTVVYAIVAPAHRNYPEELPFFTKVHLLFHTRVIRLMGYNVRLCHVHQVS